MKKNNNIKNIPNLQDLEEWKKIFEKYNIDKDNIMLFKSTTEEQEDDLKIKYNPEDYPELNYKQLKIIEDRTKNIINNFNKIKGFNPDSHDMIFKTQAIKMQEELKNVNQKTLEQEVNRIKNCIDNLKDAHAVKELKEYLIKKDLAERTIFDKNEIEEYKKEYEKIKQSKIVKNNNNLDYITDILGTSWLQDGDKLKNFEEKNRYLDYKIEFCFKLLNDRIDRIQGGKILEEEMLPRKQKTFEDWVKTGGITDKEIEEFNKLAENNIKIVENNIKNEKCFYEDENTTKKEKCSHLSDDSNKILKDISNNIASKKIEKKYKSAFELWSDSRDPSGFNEFSAKRKKIVREIGELLQQKEYQVLPYDEPLNLKNGLIIYDKNSMLGTFNISLIDDEKNLKNEKIICNSITDFFENYQK